MIIIIKSEISDMGTACFCSWYSCLPSLFPTCSVKQKRNNLLWKSIRCRIQSLWVLEQVQPKMHGVVCTLTESKWHSNLEYKCLQIRNERSVLPISRHLMNYTWMTMKKSDIFVSEDDSHALFWLLGNGCICVWTPSSALSRHSILRTI